LLFFTKLKAEIRIKKSHPDSQSQASSPAVSTASSLHSPTPDHLYRHASKQPKHHHPHQEASVPSKFKKHRTSDQTDHSKSTTNDSNNAVSASNISLGVSTLKRLFPTAKSSYLEKVLYSCSGDLIYASQQLNAEQQNKQQPPKQHQQQQQQTSHLNAYSPHLLSLSSPGNNNNNNNSADVIKSYHTALIQQQQQQHPSPMYNQYHQHFVHHQNQQQQSPGAVSFLNKASAFSPMLSASPDNHHQSVLSPFAAYTRIQQAIAAHSTNNSTQPDHSSIYNPFHQFPFNFSQFVANTTKPSQYQQQPVKSANPLASSLLINSSNGSPSSSDQNFSNSLSLDSSSSSQHHHTQGSASSSSASSPNNSGRKQAKTASNFNSPNSVISDNDTSNQNNNNNRPSTHKSSPVNEFNLE